MLVRLKSLKSGIQSHDCSHFPKAPFEEEVLSFVDSTLSSKLQLTIYCINRSQKILCINRHILYMPLPPVCIHVHIHAWTSPCLYCSPTHIHVHSLINSKTALYPVFWDLDLKCTTLLYSLCQKSHIHIS